MIAAWRVAVSRVVPRQEILRARAPRSGELALARFKESFETGERITRLAVFGSGLHATLALVSDPMTSDPKIVDIHLDLQNAEWLHFQSWRDGSRIGVIINGDHDTKSWWTTWLAIHSEDARRRGAGAVPRHHEFRNVL